MAQTRPSDRAPKSKAGRAASALTIEKGWTVYDAVGRPIGNVTDVDMATGRVEVDGRPAGFGAFAVTLDSVKQAGSNEVHLDLAFDPLTATGTTPGLVTESDASHPSDATPTHARPATASNSMRTATTTTPTVTITADRSHGPAPIWDEEQDETSYGRWLAGAGAVLAGGAAAAGVYYWRQRRRKTATQRFMLAAGNLARNRHPAWWAGLASAGLPLAYYALADRRSRTERATDLVRERTGVDRLSEWLEGMTDSGGSWLDEVSGHLPFAGDFLADDDRSPLWDLALPGTLLAVSALSLWMASQRRRGRSQRIADVMTRQPQVVRPDATVTEAASMLRRLDVGALPVCDGSRLVGMVTDRDITIRSAAEGRDPQLALVRDVMSSGVNWSTEDAPVAEAARIMREHQIRRLPIVDDRRNLVGIVSLGDLAVDVAEGSVAGNTLERVSEPARPRR